MRYRAYCSRDANTKPVCSFLSMTKKLDFQSLCFHNVCMTVQGAAKNTEEFLLGDITRFRSGLVLRRKEAKEKTEFQYPLLTLHSMNPKGRIDHDSLKPFWAAEALNPEYLTRPGEIVLRLTAPYTAVLITEVTKGIVVSSNFIIITCREEKTIPEYLAWLLNTPCFKRQIYKAASGNMLEAVTGAVFAKVRVTLPPLILQQKIARLKDLSQKECELLRRLAAEKEKLYRRTIDRIQRGEISVRGVNND